MPALEQQQQQQRPEPPLCTHQYSSAFGTYRKPAHGEDTLIKTPSSLHVLVISNGHMFSVPVKVPPHHFSAFFLNSNTAHNNNSQPSPSLAIAQTAMSLAGSNRPTTAPRSGLKYTPPPPPASIPPLHANIGINHKRFFELNVCIQAR
jgi:hypothetical protein